MSDSAYASVIKRHDIDTEATKLAALFRESAR
jgi:hypothetical protein